MTNTSIALLLANVQIISAGCSDEPTPDPATPDAPSQIMETRVSGMIGGIPYTATTAAILTEDPPEADLIRVVIGDYDVCADAPRGHTKNAVHIPIAIAKRNPLPGTYPQDGSYREGTSQPDLRRTGGDCNYTSGAYADAGGIEITGVDGQLFWGTIDTSTDEGDTATGTFRIKCVVQRAYNTVCLD